MGRVFLDLALSLDGSIAGPDGEDGSLHDWYSARRDLMPMGSDMGTDVRPSGAVSLMLACGSREEIERYFHALSEGGTVTHPLGPSFGHLTDRYGFQWTLNHTH